MVAKIEKKKLGGVRLMPKNKQNAYVVTYKYKSVPFLFFRDRGCIISKNLRKDYIVQGGKELCVQDFDFEEVKNYFVNEQGMTAIDLDLKNKVDSKKNEEIKKTASENQNKEYEKEAKGEKKVELGANKN